MSLTRKHFIELAEIFKQFQPKRKQHCFSLMQVKLELQLWDELRKRIAEFCAKHNNEFDYDRFMKASENDD